jgi:hypothetical protein
MDLDEIIRRLAKHKQRASYGAVGGVLNRPPRGLMTGRKCPLDSWVVAKTTHRKNGSVRGWPTGYAAHEVDPECRRQFQNNPGRQCQGNPEGFIDCPDILEDWLNNHP